MSVGWRRQAETDTVCDFCLMVKMFAQDRPDNAELQALARKTRLKAQMLIALERAEMQTGDIAADRIKDCEDCRRWNDGARPCERNEGRKCKYKQPEEQLKVIRRHFGDEGLRFVRWAGKLAAEMEAETCTR